MKPKRLQSLLSTLNGFDKPNVTLEQYATSPELAVAIVTYIDDLIGLKNAFVADLGSGCGMLSTAIAAFEPTTSVLAVEIDQQAMASCQENWDDAGVNERCQQIQADVLSLGVLPKMDVVVMNPPFGTKNNSAGLSCLESGGSLFSLHKSSTREYIIKTGQRWESTQVECVAQLRWELPTTYKFHKKKSVDIEVDLMHFKKE